MSRLTGFLFRAFVAHYFGAESAHPKLAAPIVRRLSEEWEQ